jgi:4-carboxymuconolactone decarboxylase
MTNDPTTHEETYERGLDMRRQVLGAEHVARSLENATEFTRPVQELVTEYCFARVLPDRREGAD